MKPILAALLVVLSLPPSAFGHGGGLDRNGCHTNRKTGEYHCHPQTAPTPTPAARPVPASQRSISPVVTLAGSDKDLVQAAQVLLRTLGYQPTLLGELDERTTAAIRSFQRAENLGADGRVTEYLVLRLAQKVAAEKCR